MLSFLRFLAGAATLLAWLHAAAASPRSGQGPDLSWPSGFTATAAGEEAEHQEVLDLVGLRVRLNVPDSWAIRRTGLHGGFVATDSRKGLRLEIAETKPTDFDLVTPLTADRLASSLQTMQANAPGGYVIEKAGQVRIGPRLWLWHESRIPSFDTSTAALYQELLRALPYRSARTWSFTATPHSQLVRVYLAVLLQDGATAESLIKTSGAGATFRHILSTIEFEPRR